MGELNKADLDRLEGKRPMGRMIEEDRACGECGYSLRGLRFGGMCPECGTPIVVNRRKREPDMGDSPGGYLAQVSLGMVLMALGGLGWIVFLVVGPLVRGFVSHPLLVGALAMCWFLGVMLILRERPFAKLARFQKGGAPEWWALRLTIAVTQLFAFGIGISSWMYMKPGASGWWAVAFGLCLFPMLVGWAPLSLYLSRLAYWAGDDGLGVRLQAMAWWLGITGFVASLVVIRPLAFFGAAGILVFVFLTVILMMMVLRMSSMVSWAERNAASARERDRRVAAKAKEEAERGLAERMAVIAAGGGGVEMTAEQRALLEDLERRQVEMEEAGEAEEVPRAGHDHVLEAPEDVKTFELEE